MFAGHAGTTATIVVTYDVRTIRATIVVTDDVGTIRRVIGLPSGLGNQGPTDKKEYRC